MQAHPVHDGAPASRGLLAPRRFGVPEPSRHHVRRDRLVERLAAADRVPLVLVSGPAGAGKTALVADWVTGATGPSGPVAWVAFDDPWSDAPTTFWPRVLACLGEVGVETASMCPGRPLLGRSGVADLAARIRATDDLVTLVLDGCELTSKDLALEVDVLLRLAHGALRLVVVAKVDPLLPLHRYRLREELVEIRAAELAFTDDEAARLLGLTASTSGSGAAGALNARVHGWAAGLRFSARALAERGSPEAFLADLESTASDVNEYLVGEVLDAQPPEVRTLLLESSVPDELVPGLLEALVGPGAAARLPWLVRANLFVEPLPHQPGCYRYYPFFRDLLRAHLLHESPTRWDDLQRRTAAWFRRTGRHDKAVVHLAEVADWDAVADAATENLLGDLLVQGANGPVAAVVARMPLGAGGAAAAVARAALALTSGARADCHAELTRARMLAEREGDPQNVLAAAAVVGALRAALGESAGEALVTAQAAERALGAPEGEAPAGSMTDLLGLVQLGRGVALVRNGRLHEAREALESVLDARVGARLPRLREECLGYLSLVEAMEGNVSCAVRLAEEADVAPTVGPSLLGAMIPPARVATARATADRYDLGAARQVLASLPSVPAPDREPLSWATAALVAATLEHAAGSHAAALERLEAAASALAPGDAWLAAQLHVEAARMHLAHGEPRLALRCITAAGGAHTPEAAGVAAAAYVELGDATKATAALSRIEGLDGGPRLRLDALLAAAGRSALNGARRQADATMARALGLARRQELRRQLVLAGPSVQRMVAADPGLRPQHLPGRRPAPAHPALDVPRPPAEGHDLDPTGPVLVEELTAKEKEVLGHLAELLTTEEVAEKMFVSVNTVRTHVRSILRKLGVNRRNAAVRKARELAIIDV